MRWDRNYKQPEVINDPVIIPAYGVTDVERAYWNAKQEALEYDRYPTLRSDKHCTSGVIHRALEDYKTSAVQLCQAFFWGQVGGLAQTKEVCEAAAEAAADSALEASSYASSAAGSALAASGSANSASGYATTASGYANAANLSKEAAALSAATAATKTEDAEAWAKGTRNGTDVGSTDPAYHNNAKYYADQASAALDIIDDTETTQYKTWSSNKISTELSGKASTSALAEKADVSALATKADLVNGKVPASQLPSYVDDVVEGYYNVLDGMFYEEATFETILTPEASKIYIDLATNKTYRWSGSAYVQTNAGLALGETAGTAYEGNKGKANADAISDIQDVIPSDAASTNKLLSTAALAGVTFTTVNNEIYINW